MITQSIYEQDFEKLSREEKMEIRQKQLEDVLYDRNIELSKINLELTQKNLDFSQKNLDFSQEILDLSQEILNLSQKNLERSKMDEHILQLKKELELFKNNQ